MKIQTADKMKNRPNRPADGHSLPGWFQRLRTGHWILDYPEIPAFLLACVISWLALTILAVIQVRNYTGGIWPLFN